jgi:hypothetical protein
MASKTPPTILNDHLNPTAEIIYGPLAAAQVL